MGIFLLLHLDLPNGFYARTVCSLGTKQWHPWKPGDASAINAGKRILHGIRRGKLAVSGADLRMLWSEAPELLRTVDWRFRRKLKYWPVSSTVGIKLWVEQLPQRENRIGLSEQCDVLGNPLMKIDWRNRGIEEKTLRVMTDATRHFWARRLAHLGTLEWRAEAMDPRGSLGSVATDQLHPAGSTRMGADPVHSVVDLDLKVHAVGNLSIASASVFPTSGSANPTYTIMQLAMRAADAIARRLEHG